MIGTSLFRTMRLKTVAWGPRRWVPLSGAWSIDGISGPATSNVSESALENIAVLGGDCDVDEFSGNFTILQASSAPPTGGAIFYLEMTAPDRFLSYHFCPAKSLVECFAREGNDWRRVGLPVPFSIGINREYHVEFALKDGVWRMRIDGKAVQAVRSLGQKGRLGLGAKLCPVRFTDLTPRLPVAAA